MYNSIELLLNNAVDHTTRVKFSQAIMYAQAIIEAEGWMSGSELRNMYEPCANSKTALPNATYYTHLFIP